MRRIVRGLLKEMGCGFVVVASEVRSLAGRSADAAKEIKGLISASVERVEQGTALVDEAGATMTEVVASIRRVTDIMGEISAASSVRGPHRANNLTRPTFGAKAHAAAATTGVDGKRGQLRDPPKHRLSA